MDLSDHYGLEENTLSNLGVSVKEQFDSLILFQPADESEKSRKKGTEKPVSEIGLLHYIDNCSSVFMDIQNRPDRKIAKALFDNLSSKFKMKVFQYIEMIEGENDESEN